MNRKRNVILTKKQLIAESIHYGPAFRKEDYVLLQEGVGGFIISLPAIIKIFRFAVDKTQEYWIKEFKKGFKNRIDERTLKSLLNPESQEGAVIPDNLDPKNAEKTIEIIEKISSIFHITSDSLEALSGVKSKVKKIPEKQKSQRKRRAIALSSHKAFDNLFHFSEILGAVGEGLHHVYKAISNLVADIIIGSAETITQTNIPDSDSKKKIIDLTGNIVFIGVVVYLIFGNGISPNATTGIKCLEIYLESAEAIAIVGTSATVLPAIKETLDKLSTTISDISEFLSLFYNKKMEEIKKSYSELTSKIESVYSELTASMNTPIETDVAKTHLDPRPPRAKRSKEYLLQNPESGGFDIYGNPNVPPEQLNNVTSESILRSYIKNMILEINHY